MRLAQAEQALRQWQKEWDEFNQRAEEPRQTAEVEQSRIQQLENIVDRGSQGKQNLEEELQQLERAPIDSGHEEQLRRLLT
ncbi:MAG: hypothetical protein CM1200mP40_27730 [Gammaproteobacteria bacterium]|nr:MAG: hypothetical protein CM1200mP40_27730 [Gammaproteobacteria bacterium]